jgi:tetratricopeptide (TPR) repeat protein
MKRVTTWMLVCCMAAMLGGFATAAEPVAGAGDDENAATREDAKPAENVDEAADKMMEALREERKVKERYKQQLADHFYEIARKRYNEGRFEEARQNLEDALAANPQHAKAKELMRLTLKVLGRDEAGRTDPLDRVRQVRVIKQKYALAEMVKTISDARERLKEDQFEAALTKLTSARNAAKVLARDIDVSREVAEINSLITQAEEAREKSEAEAEKARREKALAVAKQAQKEIEQLQEQRVARLFEDAEQLFEDTRYLQAAKKAEEILKIEPRNEAVQAFLAKCHEKQVEADLEWYAKTKKQETAAMWREVRKQAIPFYQSDPLYPDDWDEIRRRTAGVTIEDEGQEDAKWRRELEAKLEEPISFDFIATPLDDVVAFLRNLKKVNIVVDKAAVADRGALDVTLRLDKVKFRDALAWILRLLNLSYTLENGTIYISTKEKIEETKKTIIRYYDVSDLTNEPRNFKPNIRAISNADLEDQDFDDIFEENDDADLDPKTFTGESLVEFIKSVIAPGTWDVVPGGGGGLGIDLGP